MSKKLKHTAIKQEKTCATFKTANENYQNMPQEIGQR